VSPSGVIGAFVRRDWRIARTHPAPFLIDLAAVFAAAASFYYLGRYVEATRRGEDFFAFAIAGLAVLRLHGALPRVLLSTTAELASGSLELVLSSRVRTGVVLAGATAFELLRGLALAVIFVVLAGTLFGAPIDLEPAGVAAVAVGLVGATVLFAGLAVAAIGVITVIRRGAAIGSLTTVALPLLAGAYFPVDSLPQPLEALADALPFRLAVDVIREGLLDGTLDLAKSAALLAAAAVELLLAGAFANAAVERARRSGALTGD
jgi:ABC-type polysaccharide/polyol phosphate export permease